MANYRVDMAVHAFIPFTTLVRANTKQDAIKYALKNLDNATTKSSDFFGSRITWKRDEIKFGKVETVATHMTLVNLVVAKTLPYSVTVSADDPEDAETEAVDSLYDDAQAVDYNGNAVEFDTDDISTVSVKKVR